MLQYQSIKTRAAPVFGCTDILQEVLQPAQFVEISLPQDLNQLMEHVGAQVLERTNALMLPYAMQSLLPGLVALERPGYAGQASAFPRLFQSLPRLLQQPAVLSRLLQRFHVSFSSPTASMQPLFYSCQVPRIELKEKGPGSDPDAKPGAHQGEREMRGPFSLLLWLQCCCCWNSLMPIRC